MADGATLELPDALERSYAVVLFFRGSWCPFGRAQLSAFEQAREGLAAIDTKVVGLSADDVSTTHALIERHAIRFPVGHSADPAAIFAATGAFVDPDQEFLQSTGFVLDLAGRIAVSVLERRDRPARSRGRRRPRAPAPETRLDRLTARAGDHEAPHAVEPSIEARPAAPFGTERRSGIGRKPVGGAGMLAPTPWSAADRAVARQPEARATA